ncbi:family 15 glycoside hydrolase [Melampsora americana]|nr:family 15 glycoside hydrolase [Melampsora americana]
MRLCFYWIAFLLTSRSSQQLDQSLDSFILRQVEVSSKGVLANIGGTNGTNAIGVPAGVVIASPSKYNFFCWTRDAAITFQVLIENFIHGDTWLEPLIKNYVESVETIQRVDNPSGTLQSEGLGEPKFYPNQTAFLEPWGRPQRDGPALRASGLMDFGFSIWSTQPTYVSNVLWPIIQNDLSYVVNYWNMTGFDLWEEINGSSFFTIAVQHKALRKGFEFSSLFGLTDSTYYKNSGMLLCFLQSFWNKTYVISNLNVNNERSGLDVSTILASIHTFSPDLGCDEETYQPCSSRALANHKSVVDSFRNIYQINSGISFDAAIAIGRYPEDQYYDGNPWYLTTLAAAEQLYSALNVWKRVNQINVTETSLDFFQALLPDLSIGSYSSDSVEFASIISNVKAYADGFLKVVRGFIPPIGPMHEQFSKNDGMSVSAAGLTWSDVSLYVKGKTHIIFQRQWLIIHFGNYQSDS